MAVLPELQGLGLGRQLLDRLTRQVGRGRSVRGLGRDAAVQRCVLCLARSAIAECQRYRTLALYHVKPPLYLFYNGITTPPHPTPLSPSLLCP